ncbi:MAG: KH domain-containing protein [Synergistaceae bacterium]|jgi:spoIIIJ-associated protein|nr:KH domain-containing protein [Synergistaceae bacterium]
MDNSTGNENSASAVESILLEAADAEAAKAQAASLWNVSPDDLDAVVLESGKRLFGLLGKRAKVQVSTKAPIVFLHARDFTGSLMKESGLDLNVSLDEGNTINIEGEDSAIVIGRHGETLKALEFLTNLIYRPDQNMPKIRLDCGGYRMRREESLVRLAESVAREVMHRRSPVSLEPMSSWERRIIHLALQDNPAIRTSSEGEEPLRKIVVYPNGRPEKWKSPRRRFQ